MRILVTGIAGQLGHDVMNELFHRGLEGIGSDLAPVYSGAADGTPICTMPYYPLDITDAEAVGSLLRQLRPDVVVHCAAWTAVDAAEDPENREKVFAINGAGTRNLAEACRKLGCKLLYLSTDYVFSGLGIEPWQPDCQDYAPLNVYGQSKLAGEKAIRELLEKYFIIRIAWVFGRNGNNFVKTMLRLGRTHDTLRIVNDQIGTPTYTFDLACLLVDIIQTDRYGTYHATNEGGFISWYDFACEIFRQAGLPTKALPVTTEEYGLSRAARPKNSRLDKRKLIENGFTPLPAWQDALHRYLIDLGVIEA